MRVIAALVLAPLTIGVAYIGGWLWAVLVTAAAVGLYVEWLIIVNAARDRRSMITGGVLLIVTGLALALSRLEIAAGVAIMGIALVTTVSPERRGWNALGFFYAAAALMASVLVRLDAQMGFVALVFILLVVWVTDIGGYFAGRGIGGPKLWPSVSPKKTWAGAIGGLALGLVIAALYSVLGFGPMIAALAIGALLSVVSQLGDLFESAVKRRFGVKDSSQIIPGHGGLLDRLDGFVAAIVVAALIGFVRGGADGAGRGFMVW